MSSKLLPFVSGKAIITKMAPVYIKGKANFIFPHFVKNDHSPKKQQVAKKNIHPCIPIHVETRGKHFNITDAVIQAKQKQAVAPIDLI